MPLPKPKGRQRDVLYLPADGHTVVVGTAGSGKTLVAILRGAYLANPQLPNGGKTLLVTNTRALVAYLRDLAPEDLMGVTVETYHTFARGYLESTIGFGFNSVPSIGLRESLVTRAIADVKARIPDAAVLDRPSEFFSEELKWIAGSGLATAKDYVAAERTGRASARLRRSDRPVVFEVAETYRTQRIAAGKRFDWDELGTEVLAAAANDGRERLYRHIVIDEGQDFTPEMIRSLVAVAHPEGSVTFFGDYAQQIYGSRMSWQQAGLNIKKVVRFAENYRNTKAIARLALAVADMDYFADAPDLVEPSTVEADGPPPTVVACASADEEARLAAALAEQNLAQEKSAAVLVRRRDQEFAVRRYLTSDWTRLDRDMDSFGFGAGIYLGTFHAAKGMEFDSVILPHCSADVFPSQGDIDTFGRNEARAHDGRLFYVGITRARSELVITHTGPPTSLLPPDTDLYRETTA